MISRFLMKFIEAEEELLGYDALKILLTHINQAVPSLRRMSNLERYHNSKTDSINVYWDIVSIIQVNAKSVQPDFIGFRVVCYQIMISECDVISNGIIEFLTGYNKSKELLKRLQCQPS